VALPDKQAGACFKAVGAFLEKRRPPEHIRDQVDIRADITGSNLVIVEVRAAYNDKNRKSEHPVAKAKWVETQKIWRLFWMRADMKWHSYTPKPEAKSIDVLLVEVDRDPHGCFFG
jgi:hypothetical protein